MVELDLKAQVGNFHFEVACQFATPWTVVFGPSGARDVFSLPAEFFLTPLEPAPTSLALRIFGYSETALRLVNTRAQFIQPIDQIEATALDPYATFRSLYRQERASQLQVIDQRDTPTPPDWYPAAPK